ncbi:MAG TPA: signal peptide peptidase SppA [Chitinophagaceae bacterium]|nr:signal peptide peptidase SppA [Chitinophagaceae bacterium]
MKSFFKSFFAALLAMIVFTTLIFGFFFFLFGSLASSTEKTTTIGSNAVLVLDLSKEFREQDMEDPFEEFADSDVEHTPALLDMVQMVNYAAKDDQVKGIYIKCGSNGNSMAASEELRQALLNFKKSKKFIYAYSETIAQSAYYVAAVADKIYCHPQGGLEWSGFSANLLFFKGTLEKLEIEPQIFYAGKFKSATEPFREYKMTDANKVQTLAFLNDMYGRFLQAAADGRKMDTAILRKLAVTGVVQSAHDAVKYQLIDGVKYDDEVKTALSNKLKLDNERINFVSFADYAKAVSYNPYSGTDKIALVYADGDIVDGKSEDDRVIASDRFRTLLRKIRLDDGIKAVVFRVNSPGGSALASDVIWREITLIKKKKPVIVSMGDYAASGGYYIACAADSVFANPSTLTGSIGVFGIIPNMQAFLKNKLGITGDGVKTAPYADMGSIDRPLTEMEKRFVQNSIDSIYHTFKTRVANGRKLSIEYVDSIAQGRVWTGAAATKIGLVDRNGTLQDAIASAAKMAKTSSYQIRTYPDKINVFDQIFKSFQQNTKAKAIREEIGEDQYKLLKEWKKVQEMVGVTQARLPYNIQLRF